MASSQKGSWRQPAQGKCSFPCDDWNRLKICGNHLLPARGFRQDATHRLDRCIVAPFALALSLLAALLVFLFDICAFLLTIASVILAVLGIALFFTPTPIGGIVFLFLAFLLSPYGLQAAAGSLLWALDGGKSALYRFLAS